MKTKVNKVQELREDRIWTISELAKRAELTPQTVSKIEKGLNTSKISKLKVAKAFVLPYKQVF